MQALLDTTWQKVQPALRARVGDSVHDGWLKDLRPLALERGVFHLEGRNRMVCDRVMQFYRGVLAEILSEEIGTRLDVAVEPAPESLVPDELEVGPAQPILDTSNRTAWLLLQAVHEGRPLPSNLFFFHGPSGSGKSFLLRWWTHARRPACRVFDGASLVRTFQAALREQRVPGLVDELCGPFDLVVDEAHRMAGHRRIQRELARVLERRTRGDHPTLIAARWHPHEIRDLEPVLATWFLAGFVTRIDLPGPQARLAYLRALEGAPSRNGRAVAIETLARDVQGGYPELRRAWAFQRHGRSGRFTLVDPRSTFETLRDRVAERLCVPVEDLVGATQQRSVSQARKILGWLCTKEGLSRAEVGRFLGRTRAAISYAVKSLEEEMGTDPELRRRVEDLL